MIMLRKFSKDADDRGGLATALSVVCELGEQQTTKGSIPQHNNILECGGMQLVLRLDVCNCCCIRHRSSTAYVCLKKLSYRKQIARQHSCHK